ncbi:HNH endonuclease [Pseudomonas asuensis]
MNSQNDPKDPANVSIDQVNPLPGLGASFETTLLSPLLLSSKSRIFGDKSGQALEPVLSTEQRKEVLKSDSYKCMFCGYHSVENEIHSLSDNHQDDREENLRVADPLCHRWQHLGELSSTDAVMVYLPGLSAQDLNHLQRTIMVALETGDDQIKKDANKILNWLGSHRDYIKEAWGSYEPNVFAEALLRLKEEDKEKRSSF